MADFNTSLSNLVERVKYRLACWYLENAFIGQVSQYVYEKDRQFNGPRCPDCQIGPDVGDNCPVCADIYETKKRDEAIMGAAYEDGYQAAERARESEGHW